MLGKTKTIVDTFHSNNAQNVGEKMEKIPASTYWGVVDKQGETDSDIKVFNRKVSSAYSIRKHVFEGKPWTAGEGEKAPGGEILENARGWQDGLGDKSSIARGRMQ
ncbi:hypothetical protein PoB_003149600 [Plakobranchus ocellatus]|uniref:Uncharacterized protein n=1 Tax=Plakobranchus ocellatus TaxID=259542 RepID=A0AAV4A1A1_9GAST|nr:hypothetical protein PoB_003149600 [Plakobranchus ocellatus]